MEHSQVVAIKRKETVPEGAILLTAKQGAKRPQLGVRAFQKLGIPKVRLNGGVRYRPEDIQAFIQQNLTN